MEEQNGKLRMIKGKLIVGNKEFEYEEYRDPNRPHNLRTLLFHCPGKDDIITEFDTERDVLQQVAEKILK